MSLLCFKSCVPHICAAQLREPGKLGGYMTALLVGLVSIAVVWVIVIYGSNYLNKNVQ